MLAEVLVGRRRVAHVELHRLADLDLVAHGEAPDARSPPSTLRTRKSPRSKSSLVLVDDDAEV